MTAVYYALSCLLGYLLGSISIAILISRHVFHQDVRQSGSGNAGATNVARVFGLGAGVLTFLGDFAKTLLAAWLGSLLGGVIGSCLGAAFALIGHCFPVYWPTHSQQKFCSEECQKQNHNEKSLEFYHKKQKEKSKCKDLLQTKEPVSSTNSSEIITIPA